MISDTTYRNGSMLFMLALLMLLFGLGFGMLSALEYVIPGYLKSFIGFEKLRPLHVSCVQFWILIGGSACVHFGLNQLSGKKMPEKLVKAQVILWSIAIIGMMYSYFNSDFGGREYWEFNPIWSLPIALSWLIFLVGFIHSVRSIRIWPVYIWMWLTGIVFFVFIFAENHLWLFEYFRSDPIKDMTIQWKVNGSLVGSWNQIIYGTAFFMMDRISGTRQLASSKLAFAMYFLGLFNLMFNWGHHIYTLPTESYIRYVGYVVSMTEWVFFIRIVYNWKKSISLAKSNYHYFPYRFLLAADVWIFINMFQAIIMSIPAFNIYTHGTHVTVAHAMGTTIGINTMILMAAGFEFLGKVERDGLESKRWIRVAFYLSNFSLLVFWFSLNIAGLIKGIRQVQSEIVNYSLLMKELLPWFLAFAIAGMVLMFALSVLAYRLLKARLIESNILR